MRRCYCHLRISSSYVLSKMQTIAINLFRPVVLRQLVQSAFCYFYENTNKVWVKFVFSSVFCCAKKSLLILIRNILQGLLYVLYCYNFNYDAYYSKSGELTPKLRAYLRLPVSLNKLPIRYVCSAKYKNILK